jgi:DNA repair photolyase
MIIRDIDVLQEAARKAKVSVSFSIPTIDPEIWRRTEPGRHRRASVCAR